MTTQNRRIYNRTASAHISVSTPIPSPSSLPSSTSTAPQVARKPASSPPPPTLSAPTGPVGAKKKKKKRSKTKSGITGTGSEPPLGDEDLDYSHRDGYDDDRDSTDDDIPDLVDIDRPPLNQSLSVPMTATSSNSSKTPPTTGAGNKSKKKKKKNKAEINDGTSNGLDGQTKQSNENDHKSQTSPKIWNTNGSEERERIREFWQQLSEQERRALVRIDKDTVTKRFKEASKFLHCACHVCGRRQYHH